MNTGSKGGNEKIARNLRDVFPHPYTLAGAQGFTDGCMYALLRT